MRIAWICSLALLAACGGAVFTAADGTDAGHTNDAAPSSPKAPADAGAFLDATSKPPPTPASDAGQGDAGHTTSTDAGDGSAPLPPSDTCPNTTAYAYEFSNAAIDAPLCGPQHGGACADPSNDCCFYDYVSNAYVCLSWLRDE